MFHRIASGAALGFACILLATATGCSTFHHDSRAAAARTIPAGSIEGKWAGTWHDSKRTDHGGAMECVLTRTGEHLYHLSSRSHWWKWFTSSIDTTVVVTPVAPGRFSIQGARHIWGFGDYSMDGVIDGEKFDATYVAGGYHGVIELRRPAR